MNYRKHIWMLLLGCTLMACSRQALHEAQQVVSEADSLWRAGKMYSDTAALLKAADVFQHHVAYDNECARCYYYVGKNNTQKGNTIAATRYFIKSDRLEPSDYVLRGRINSNMANVCAQINDDSLALIFDNLSSSYFQKACDTPTYAYSLLNICRRYTLLKQFEKADSIWNVASTYKLDFYYTEQLFRYRASLDWHKGNYDEALLALKQCPEDTTEMHDMLCALAHDDKGDLDSASYYAQRILKYSNRPSYHVSAYFILEEQAKRQKDIARMDEYFHKRQDADSTAHAIIPDYENAVQLLREHLNYPIEQEKRDRTMNILIIVCLCAIVLGGALFGLHHYRDQKKENGLLKSQNKAQYVRIYATLEQRKNLFSEKNLKEALHWDDEPQFQSAINLYFMGMAGQLQMISSKITVQDIKLYVLVLMNFSQNKMAEILGRSPKSMKNLKQVSAAKLNVSSKQLRQKLLDVIASVEGS